MQGIRDLFRGVNRAERPLAILGARPGAIYVASSAIGRTSSISAMAGIRGWIVLPSRRERTWSLSRLTGIHDGILSFDFFDIRSQIANMRIAVNVLVPTINGTA